MTALNFLDLKGTEELRFLRITSGQFGLMCPIFPHVLQRIFDSLPVFPPLGAGDLDLVYVGLLGVVAFVVAVTLLTFVLLFSGQFLA